MYSSLHKYEKPEGQLMRISNFIIFIFKEVCECRILNFWEKCLDKCFDNLSYDSDKNLISCLFSEVNPYKTMFLENGELFYTVSLYYY